MPVLSVHPLLISLALVSAIAGGSGGTASAQTRGQAVVPPAGQQQLIQPNATLVERLRRLLNLSPPLAVGGSRSGAGSAVCVISPRFQHHADGRAIAAVALPQPTLLAAEPLNEVRLIKDGRIVWQQRASSTEPIEGPIPWPLQPLQPGESVLLRLRPRGASGSDFADIQLVAASKVEQQRAQALLNDEPSRLAAIEAEASAGRAVLASELLFAPLDQAPEAIQLLRRELIEQGCGITTTSP
jgi:hypothetical protein